MTDKKFIRTVVSSFYALVREDVLIGYHFRNVADFDKHIPRIWAFWELQLLGRTDTPIPSPFDLMNVHLPMGIKKGELGRWMVLFRRTLEEVSRNNPDHLELKQDWEVRLKKFESTFSRFLGL